MKTTKHTNDTLYLQNVISQNEIIIPSKIESVFKHISEEKLRLIDLDLHTAKETCYLFISYLSRIREENEFISMQKQLLYKFIFGSENSKNKVKMDTMIEILSTGTDKKGAIIEISDSYSAGYYSKGYRLADIYYKKGYKRYIVTSDKIMKRVKDNWREKIKAAQKNTICQNLFIAYNSVELPSEAEIIAEAKRLIKSGYVSRKGKQLRFINNTAESKLDRKKYSYVDEHIKMFNILTGDGKGKYLVPVPGSIESGGRVIDSFTLMPSWIRKMCKMNGKLMCECDYSCLHPNIAVMIYGGNTKYITHSKVADTLGEDLRNVKTEHLSFFNKRVDSMKKSPLWQYYYENEPNMLQNIVNEKQKSEFKHKVTSRDLFAVEVALMTEVIKNLNNIGIFVIYVYDALYCSFIDRDEVVKEMNKVALKYKIYTTAK